MASAKRTTKADDAPKNTKSKNKTLTRHPLSEKFALPMTDEERFALGQHMNENGQINPIVLYEGMVLEGWERYLQAHKLGITFETKTYEGPNPAAIAFGANVIRRRLSGVQKALFGAKYLVHEQSEGRKVTQNAVAKLACCSLQRLNELVQLIRAADSSPDAARCLSTLNTTSDISTSELQEMLVQCGIVKAEPRRNAATSTDTDGAPSGEDDGEDLIGGETATSDDDDGVDLLGGADIDDLLDSEDGGPPAQRGNKENPSKTGGKRIGHDNRARETPASLCNKHFRALTEPERIDFVKFAWAMLRPAIEAAVDNGRVEWPRLGVKPDAGAAALADAALALAKGGDDRGRKGKRAAKAPA